MLKIIVSIILTIILISLIYGLTGISFNLANYCIGAIIGGVNTTIINLSNKECD